MSVLNRLRYVAKVATSSGSSVRRNRVGSSQPRSKAAYSAPVEAFVELDPKAGQDAQCVACGRVDRETHTQRPFSRAS